MDEKKKRSHVHTLIRPYLSLILVIVVAACDTADPGAFEEDYVLEAYLVAGSPLRQVRLSRTIPVNRTYDFSALAVSGADVRLFLLDDEGSVQASYSYREATREPGVYRADDTTVRVEPLRAYRLEVTIPQDGHRITASTVVPDTFSVVGGSADSLVFQGTEQLELTVTRSRSPGRAQSYFLFVTEALDAREELLTPFAKALFEQQEGEVTIEDLRVNGSPILSEANYDPNPDGTLTLRYPWLGIAFYGRNRISANAIDDNLYDYVRSQSVQQDGSVFSPGEIPNPIEPVQGARGVFGSYARVSYDLFVKRSEDEECAVIGSSLVCGEDRP